MTEYSISRVDFAFFECGFLTVVVCIHTSLPPHETDGCRPPFSRVGINVDHEKKVDLGVLRDADHNGLIRRAAEYQGEILKTTRDVMQPIFRKRATRAESHMKSWMIA